VAAGGTRASTATQPSGPAISGLTSSAASTPTPALNALATIMLVASLLAVVLGFVVYRRLTRGERSARPGVEDFAAQL
jgi:spermidine/putrescine transport system permease protein